MAEQSETIPLYNIHEGRNGRDEDAFYLQDEERRQAEIVRAKREGREPDFDNLPPYVGDVLVPAEALPGTGEVTVDPVVEVEVPKEPTEVESEPEPEPDEDGDENNEPEDLFTP